MVRLTKPAEANQLAPLGPSHPSIHRQDVLTTRQLKLFRYSPSMMATNFAELRIPW